MMLSHLVHSFGSSITYYIIIVLLLALGYRWQTGRRSPGHGRGWSLFVFNVAYGRVCNQDWLRSLNYWRSCGKIFARCQTKTDLIQQCKEMNLPVHTSTGVSGRLLSSQELFDMSHRWKGVSPASRQASSDKAANTNTRYVEAFGGLSLRVNKHVCSGCRRHFFDPNDLHVKLKSRGSEHALLCGYISNSCSTMTELKLITIFLFRRLGEMMKKDPRACPDPRSSISIGGKAFLGETVKMA